MTDTYLLDAFIKKKGFSRADIAEELGISEMTLYRKLHNQSEFTASEIYKLSKVLNIPPGSPIFFSQEVTDGKH